MPTNEQAQIYNAARNNEDWLDLTPSQARALLQDAENYIRSYPLRSNLNIDEHTLLEGLICRLASEFQKAPPQVTVAPLVKKEKSEMKGMISEVEYFAPGSDPYPYITTLLRPLLKRSSSSGGVRFSRMTR